MELSLGAPGGEQLGTSLGEAQNVDCRGMAVRQRAADGSAAIGMACNAFLWRAGRDSGSRTPEHDCDGWPPALFTLD